MKPLVLLSVFLFACSDPPYLKEALKRYCPPELHAQVTDAINQCHARQTNNSGYKVDQLDCFALVTVTFCPPLKEKANAAD